MQIVASAQVPSQILEAEFWVKKKSIALSLCQAKGDHSEIMPSKPVCLNSGGLGEFYRNGLQAGLLIRISCAGPVPLQSGLRWVSDALL